MPPSSLARLLILGLPIVVGSCANPAAQRAQLAQTALVGMPKPALLSCAGVPERTAREGDLEFLTYETRQVWSDVGTSFGFGVGTDHLRYGFGLPLAQTYATATCEATFTLRNGVVERVVYGGSAPAGRSRVAQCYEVVRNCLPAGT